MAERGKQTEVVISASCSNALLTPRRHIGGAVRVRKVRVQLEELGVGNLDHDHMREVTHMAIGEMAELEQAIVDYLLEPKKKRVILETEIREGVQDILKRLQRIGKELSWIDHVLQGRRK